MFDASFYHYLTTKVFPMAINLMIPIMVTMFTFGFILRSLVFYTVKRHEWFAREFEKRVNRYLEKEIPGQRQNVSFYTLTKKTLERTYYEVFENRDKLNRRRTDKMMSLSDRVFLIKQGTAWLVKDILKQVKFLKWNEQPPKLLNLTKNTFSQNPCFNRIFGLIPLSGTNDLLSILPSIFVIAGIFGTFLGIAKGLPSIGEMRLDNMEQAQKVMQEFLSEISVAMISSITGIFLSVIMTLANAIMNPDKVFVHMVDRFENSLDMLWHRCDNNVYPVDLPEFDENKDPVEALAEEALNTEVSKAQRVRNLEELRKVKA